MSTNYAFRHAVRALLINEHQQVLLIQTWVPDSDSLIWLAPGGGIEPGEAPLEALYREIYEETGLQTDAAQGPIWTRQLKFKLHGKGYDQYEEYFWVPCTAFEPSASHNPAQDERQIFRGFKWWSLTEIAVATEEIFVPLQFAHHFAQALELGPPAQAIDVGR